MEGSFQMVVLGPWLPLQFVCLFVWLFPVQIAILKHIAPRAHSRLVALQAQQIAQRGAAAARRL